MEFAIDPAKFRDAFAADLPAEQTAVIAATQRPVAEAAFSEPSGPPDWKRVPSWAAVASADTAAGTDVILSMAKRAGATITQLEGSHVIMISQPEAVTEVILQALSEVGSRNLRSLGRRVYTAAGLAVGKIPRQNRANRLAPAFVCRSPIERQDRER